MPFTHGDPAAGLLASVPLALPYCRGNAVGGLGRTLILWLCLLSSLSCEGSLDPRMKRSQGVVPSSHELVFSHHPLPHVLSTARHKLSVFSPLPRPLLPSFPLPLSFLSPSLSRLPFLASFPPCTPFSLAPHPPLSSLEGKNTCCPPSPTCPGPGLTWHTPVSISRRFPLSLWVAAAGLLRMEKKKSLAEALQRAKSEGISLRGQGCRLLASQIGSPTAGTRMRGSKGIEAGGPVGEPALLLSGCLFMCKTGPGPPTSENCVT